MGRSSAGALDDLLPLLSRGRSFDDGPADAAADEERLLADVPPHHGT